MSSTHKNCSTPARGKKNAKQAQKKQPGRGMGVAQLERIRIHSLITDLNPGSTGFNQPTPPYYPRPEMLAATPNVDCGSWGHFDFNTFNFKKKRVVNGEAFEGFVENKCFQGPEIVAVHRKGRSIRSVVMEYGFFPTTSTPSSTVAAASSSTSTAYYPSSSIDLSLRL